MGLTDQLADTAGCAGCGSCCDPVIMNSETVAVCGQRARSQEFPHVNDVFITQHWRPLSAWTEGGQTWLRMRCDMFDPVQRRCTAYEDRPPVCSRFPWYGDQPGDTAALRPYPQCSYWADVPPADRPEGVRPLIPLTVVQKPVPDPRGESRRDHAAACR